WSTAPYHVDSATQITVNTVPAAVGPGVVDVQVFTSAGSSALNDRDKYTYVAPAPPVVTTVTPANGPEAGGNKVILAGLHFDGASAVHFGTTAATDFTVDNANQITVNAVPAATKAGP